MFSVSSLFKSEILLDSAITADATSVEVSYQFQKSFQTKYTFSSNFSLDGTNKIYSTEFESIPDIPIKHNGIVYFEYIDPVQGEIKLEENIDFKILSYGNPEDGTFITFQF